MAPGIPRAYFLIVRGPLGAGKTTVSRAVAAQLGGDAILIDALLERFAWDGGSEALFLRTNAAASEAVRTVIADGRPALVDGNFYGDRRSGISRVGSRCPARRSPSPHRSG